MNRLVPAIIVWTACTFPALSADPEQASGPNGDPLQAEGFPRMLVPGFTVRELPVELTSLNNIEYAEDGRLFAGGYDGRFHLLRDTDGDDLEDKVDTFWPETSPNYPLGIAVKDGDPHYLLMDEIVRFRDTDGDLIPDTRETVVKGFDDPALTDAPFIHHRRVDSAMAIAPGPDDSWYITMGNAGFNNAYWHDRKGTPHYSTDKRRGCLLRISADGTVEHLASGLRYVMSLQWNKHKDLFATDQEGATWVPNGNPFDEFLHVQPGRHYGFPPRHPKWLSDVTDEPSVWNYAPQHQSTCGFRFNTPRIGRGRFGPSFWEDDAIVTGQSRGKLLRTKLSKSTNGYIATTQLIGRMQLLVVDCAISPRGDLVICCHTGKPDWGNGPAGRGRIFQISYTDPRAPQPVVAWAESETKTVIAFDRALDSAGWVVEPSNVTIDSGQYVTAAERLERMRPPYSVVGFQQAQDRRNISVTDARISADGHQLLISTEPRSEAVHYAVSIPAYDVAHDMGGLSVQWNGADSRWVGWLPHADFTPAREFTRGSAIHNDLWTKITTSGEIQLRTQLDLFEMLQPATQPTSQLDYTPEPETTTLVFTSDSKLDIKAQGAEVQRVSDRESRLTVTASRKNAWQPLLITLTTPASFLNVSFSTTRDPRPRALQTKRFLMPFATTASATIQRSEIPEIAGGNWKAGEQLFSGKANCAKCHKLRRLGTAVGPDLHNLVHRDYASVLRDIVDPSAVINPDAIGYSVLLDDGRIVLGTRVHETEEELHIVVASGHLEKLRKSNIIEVKPMKVSPMPTGIEKLLSKEELRDLMTFLLLTQPAK